MSEKRDPERVVRDTKRPEKSVSHRRRTRLGCSVKVHIADMRVPFAVVVAHMGFGVDHLGAVTVYFCIGDVHIVVVEVHTTEVTAHIEEMSFHHDAVLAHVVSAPNLLV